MFRKYFSFPLIRKTTYFILVEPFLLETGQNFIPKRGAGHAKWQNIKGTKEAADFQKSNNFQRISKLIMMAVKSGGEDPSTNPKLKSLMEEAQKANMPKATVQKAITNAKAQQVDQPYWVVYTGPRGIALGLEVTFANKNSQFLNSKIAPQAKKLNMKMEVHFQNVCTEKGVIVAKRLGDDANLYDKALEDAIEVGAEEVIEGENSMIIFECLPNRLDGVCTQLTKLGYEIDSATIELDFKEQVVLSDEEKKNIATVVTKLQEQHEEIVRVTYNASA